MKRSIITVPAILLLLALLILAPLGISGYQNERNARAALAAGDHLYAAQQFELAARRLFWKPQLWNEAADLYIHADRLEEALLAYKNAKEKDVLSLCGWVMLGSCAEFPLSFWQEAVRHYPENAILYINIAWQYRLLGDNDLEREYLLSALAHESSPKCDLFSINFSEVHYRAGILLMQDDPNRALDELNTAARTDVQFAPVVETLRTSLNLASLESHPAEKLILLGRGLALTGEWQLAASAFDNATQAAPESASAWAWLAESQYQLGKDALPAFEKAASIDPNAPTLLSLRGLYWQQQNDFESALRDVEKLAALEPENPTWQTSLGALYAALGDLPTALLAYERAVELVPTDPAYRQFLALFSFNYGYDLAGTGISAARRAVILAPEEAQYIDTLGLLYLGLDRDDDAGRQFLRSLEKDADYAAAHLHLGMLYLKRGHPELAYASLVQARELATDSAVHAQSLRLLDQYFQP